ncbi:hypothetical protein FRB99_006010 [Tulasnella sp. 403]|nr:hypothetical protein FRB99_006010 [Tulasnella sp. 403]
MSEPVKTATKQAAPLPPGMVLGPDGKPCKICTSWRVWAKAKTGTPKAESAPPKKAAASTTLGSFLAAVGTVSATSGTKVEEEPVRPADCPPDVEQLGRSTWTFLHTTAAYYPEKPTPAQQSDMLALLRALPTLYPCSWCASHLKDNLREFPPDKAVAGRGPLSKWLCDRHNDVNRRLGKDIFDCSKTDERWKDGDARCD